MLALLCLLVHMSAAEYGVHGISAVYHYTETGNMVLPVGRIHGCVSAGFFVASHDTSTVTGFAVVEASSGLGLYTYVSHNYLQFMDTFWEFKENRDNGQATPRSSDCKTWIQAWISAGHLHRMDTARFPKELAADYNYFLHDMGYKV